VQAADDARVAAYERELADARAAAAAAAAATPAAPLPPASSSSVAACILTDHDAEAINGRR
jgi:hypothetical protein